MNNIEDWSSQKNLTERNYYYFLLQVLSKVTGNYILSNIKRVYKYVIAHVGGIVQS